MATTKLEISEAVSRAVRNQIDRVGSTLASDSSNVDQIPAPADMLPLMFESGGFYGLRPDGQLVAVSWDSPDKPEDVVSLRLRDIALRAGTQSYPFLATLLPTRLPSSRTCAMCGGTGKGPLEGRSGSESILCWCGGFGWIPDYWEDDDPA